MSVEEDSLTQGCPRCHDIVVGGGDLGVDVGEEKERQEGRRWDELWRKYRNEMGMMGYLRVSYLARDDL